MMFKFSRKSHGGLARILISILMIAIAVFLLMIGEKTSFLEGEGQEAAPVQNYAANVAAAFVLGTIGFLGIFRVWRNRHLPNAVVVTEDTIASPHQGVFGRYVEIRLAEILRIQKLSVDGVWELNVEAENKKVRVTKASLADSNDFGKLADLIQERVPWCTMNVVKRVDPPRV